MTTPHKQEGKTEVLAVVPARGGSKGIPRKNLALVAGKPLLGHILLAAKAATLVDRLVVSTDDDEIAVAAKLFGADVVMRPTEISGDNASSEAALLHVLEYLENTEGYRPRVVALLQATAPLTTAEDIDCTIRKVVGGEFDCSLAVTPFHYFLWREDSDGSVSGINHEHSARALRQNREPQYLECGSVYVFRSDGFREVRHRFFGRVGIHVVNPSHRLEIDEPHDLELAAILMGNQQRNAILDNMPAPPSGLVMDFDGVFTDNTALVTEDGTESVAVNRSDGMGIARLKACGFPMLVLSTEVNPVVAARCNKLQIEFRQGLTDKLLELKKWAAQKELDFARLVYVGNDVNDVPCLQAVGFGVAVADAYPAAISASRAVLARAGGKGAVREIADLIVEALNRTNRDNR
jgi:N-acylneuraminate cytidylyltransferase